VFGASVYLSEIVKAQGWTTATVSTAITVFYLTNALSLPAIGALIDRYGPRPAMGGGIVLLALGVAALGRLDALWQLYAAFTCMGLGYATMSVTGLSAAIAPWFERHQGRSVSLALTGASLGAMLVVPLLVLAIAHFGFAAATLRAAILMVAVLLPLALVVLRFRNPAQLGLARDGGPLAPAPAPGGDNPDSARETAKTARRAVLRSIALWSVALGFALGLMVQVGFLTHHYALAEPLLGTAGAGWLVGATGLARLLGRLLLARIIDGIDPRRYSMGIMALQAVALGTVAMAPVVPVLVPVSLVCGFCLGQITTLSPIVVRREFGAEAFGSVYGVAGTVIQFCSAFGPVFFGVLVTLLGGYAPVLGIAAGFEALAIAVLWYSIPRRKSLTNG
ncbi:MAG: MFS transporter, partial [Proteobacteria bacterium]|nr:MFS transporter [Pseudomonadota bacterium]